MQDPFHSRRCAKCDPGTTRLLLHAPSSCRVLTNHECLLIRVWPQTVLYAYYGWKIIRPGSDVSLDVPGALMPKTLLDSPMLQRAASDTPNQLASSRAASSARKWRGRLLAGFTMYMVLSFLSRAVCNGLAASGLLDLRLSNSAGAVCRNQIF